MTTINNPPLQRWWGRFTTLTPLMQTYPGGDDTYKPERDRRNETYTRTWELNGARIPVISGDSFRGRLRRALAWDLLNRLEIRPGSLPVRVAHLLFVGGSLNKDKGTLQGQLAEIRALVPPFALLGGTALGEFAAGRLCAGEWVAHSAQTPEVCLPDGVEVEGLPDAKHLFITQSYARNGGELLEMYSPEELTSAYEDGAMSANANITMPHKYLAVAPATTFSGSVGLRGYFGLTEEADAVQRSCLRHGIELAFPQDQEVTIGLRASCGWGVVKYDWSDLDGISPDSARYTRFIEENAAAIRALMPKLVPEPLTSGKAKAKEPASEASGKTRARSGRRREPVKAA